MPRAACLSSLPIPAMPCSTVRRSPSAPTPASPGATSGGHPLSSRGARAGPSSAVYAAGSFGCRSLASPQRRQRRSGSPSACVQSAGATARRQTHGCGSSRIRQGRSRQVAVLVQGHRTRPALSIPALAAAAARAQAPAARASGATRLECTVARASTPPPSWRARPSAPPRPQSASEVTLRDTARPGWTVCSSRAVPSSAPSTVASVLRRSRLGWLASTRPPQRTASRALHWLGQAPAQAPAQAPLLPAPLPPAPLPPAPAPSLAFNMFQVSELRSSSGFVWSVKCVGLCLSVDHLVSSTNIHGILL